MIDQKTEPTAEARITTVVDQLRAAGYRLTPQRLAILRLLVSDERHPSIEEIFQQIRREYPMVSLATIYNTVQKLKELGAVLELPFAGGNRYDGVHPYPHAHLVCTQCGHIEDIAAPGVLESLAMLLPDTGYSNPTPRVEISGICPQCATTGIPTFQPNMASYNAPDREQ